VATKFGRIFQKQLRHHVILRRKIERELIKCSRQLRRLKRKSQLDTHIILLVDFLLEINQAVTECFKLGYVSSGLHELRLAQEISHKLLAIQLKPQLVGKKKVSAREVRDVLKEQGLADWKGAYNRLSMVSHHYKQFLEEWYPSMRINASIAESDIEFLKYWLTVLNILNMKALAVLLTQLKPHVGAGDDTLFSRWSKLDRAVQADWRASDELLKAIRLNHSFEGNT